MLENLEIVVIVENNENPTIIRDSREFRDFRDSRDFSSERPLS